MITNKSKVHIDISIQDPVWGSIEELHQRLKSTVKLCIDQAALPHLTKSAALEISLVLANDDLIQILNREYRQKDKPTNVLTFATLDTEEPQNAETVSLGDVILSYQTIEKEALEQGKSFLDHSLHMITHGTLHLLGYDHIEDGDAITMETLEIRILEKLGIQNPYTDTISVV